MVFHRYIFILSFIVISIAGISAAELTTSKPVWYTIRNETYDPKSNLSDKEAYEVISHPIYLELSEDKKRFDMKILELTTGLHIMQISQNTGAAVVIGRGNVIPAVNVEGIFWLQSWLGLNIGWMKGIVMTFGSQNNEDSPNSVLLMPTWLQARIKLRYNFDKRDGSSFIAFNAGYYSHDFPINTSSDFINKKTASGAIFGAQRRFAMSPMLGFDFNFDMMLLNKLLDVSDIINTQNGIGYRFTVDFYATIIDRTGLKTVLSIGYGQTSYISYLSGAGTSEDNRDFMEANHFEQTYRDVHIAFTARI
jgi:hypothetical protein